MGDFVALLLLEERARDRKPVPPQDSLEEERVCGRGHVLPEEGEPQNHPQERTAEDRARPNGGAETAAQGGEGLQSVGGRVFHPTAQTGRL